MERLNINNLIKNARFIHRGAESDLYEISYLDIPAIIKWRRPKPYRIEELDEEIRRERVIRETSIMIRLKENNISVPIILFVSPEQGFFIMEKINGLVLREYLLRGNTWRGISKNLGELVATMHNMNIVHGDLTTSNIILKNEKEIYLIDFGLSLYTEKIDEKASDLDLLYRVLTSTHTDIANRFFKEFIKSYIKNSREGGDIYRQFKILQTMGRYIPREARVWK